MDRELMICRLESCAHSSLLGPEASELCEALRLALADTVPRSRVKAMDEEIAALEAKLAKVQRDAGAEIERLQTKLDAIRAGVPKLLEGIDLCDSDYPGGGWWETSTGAEYGARVLKQIVSLLADKRCDQYLTPKLTCVLPMGHDGPHEAEL